MGPKVLIIDSEKSSQSLCADVLRGLGLGAQIAESGSRALSILESGEIDIVLADACLATGEGAELLDVVKRDYPQVEIVMAVGPAISPAWVQAIKAGAAGYVTKPLRAKELRDVLQHLVERRELTDENRLLREQLKTHQGFCNLIGTSVRMEEIYRKILKVAPRRDAVLLRGESGTGKELVARAVHANSPWKDKPFIPIDCGALTPTLIESELFGHVRGAFTGATQSRQGLLAAAGSGTVFLDEIAELPVELQAKLLRVLQEREIRPVGSNERTRLEARVIAATNQEIEPAVRRGTFRKDLYYRLNVVSIKLPALRERKGDIPALVHYFIDRHGGAENGITGVSYEAMSRLMTYDWPGNVRELENCIQRAMTMGSGPEIQVADLPTNLLNFMRSSVESEQVTTLRELERRAILQALEATGGDRLRAARLLGIGKTTIYRKLKEYGLEGALPIPPSA